MDRRSPAPSCGDLRQADETKAHRAGFVIGADTAHIGQLGTVVDAALAWVNQEMDDQAEVIRADLLARDYADLIALPPPMGNTPHTGSIRRRR